VKVIGATFRHAEDARRASARMRAEIDLSETPQVARAVSPDEPGHQVTLVGARVPEDATERARAIVEEEGGRLETEVSDSLL
jgi:hypothetical protein